MVIDTLFCMCAIVMACCQDRLSCTHSLFIAVSAVLNFSCSVSSVETLHICVEVTCCSTVCICCLLRSSVSSQASLSYLFSDSPASDLHLRSCHTCLDLEILASQASGPRASSKSTATEDLKANSTTRHTGTASKITPKTIVEQVPINCRSGDLQWTDGQIFGLRRSPAVFAREDKCVSK